MTDRERELIAEAQQLTAAATPGHWAAERHLVLCDGKTIITIDSGTPASSWHDADFVAASRRIVPEFADVLSSALDRCEAAEASCAAMRAALENALHPGVFGLCGRESIRSLPGDDEVREMCERRGYGDVMNRASELWATKDPIAAHTTAACRFIAQKALAQMEAALSSTADHAGDTNKMGEDAERDALRDRIAELEACLRGYVELCHECNGTGQARYQSLLFPTPKACATCAPARRVLGIEMKP